ncbi:MAG: TldD/PmbA family protein [Methanobacteriaceae archaeon]|nr:TldD/PmbA family protein [Candidatus Methanorudis spinitermitis]
MLFEISEEAKKEILKYCNEFEIFIEREKSLGIDSQKKSLNFAKEEYDIGIGIRIINNGKLGFAYTSNLDKIGETAESAFLNCKSNEKDLNFSFSHKSKLPKVANIYDKKFEEFELSEASDFMNSALATVEEEKCEATSGNFSATSVETLITNSNDLCVFNKSTGFYGNIAVNAEKNGKKSTAYDSISSCSFDLDPMKLSKQVCEIAKDSINGVKIETNDMDVVLDYHANIGLLNTFINALNSDNVQRGRSILAGNVDKAIVSDCLSIYDDGKLDGRLFSATTDSEGTPSEKTTLIEDGILKGFIYDNYTANKSKVKSTGNGMRGTYTTTPSVDTSNIVLDFKSMIDISEIDKGFIATDVLGAHTANPISGDFSVEANNAFLVENGEITKPVKKAMISGNIFKALANCKGIKSEIRQCGSFIIPKIMCKDLRVVG